VRLSGLDEVYLVLKVDREAQADRSYAARRPVRWLLVLPRTSSSRATMRRRRIRFNWANDTRS